MAQSQAENKQKKKKKRFHLDIFSKWPYIQYSMFKVYMCVCVCVCHTSEN